MASKRSPAKRLKRKPSAGPMKDEQIRVRVTAEQKQALVAAARRRGLPVSNWLVSLGLREVESDGRASGP